MDYSIKLAEKNEEREGIFRLRYNVFIEELGKSYLKADNEKKLMYDEADEKALLYFIKNEMEETIATVRVMGGLNPLFPNYSFDLFRLNQFEQQFKKGEVAIADRIIVAPAYRNFKIADKLHHISFQKGIEWGTKICFCSCDANVLPMYLHYGWRSYTEPETLASGKKRFPLLLILNDCEYLKRINSPYLQHFPNGTDEADDKGAAAHKIREMGFVLG